MEGENLNAVFFKSSAQTDQCPEPDLPEYAFIGRSNVGKSSLINMLCNNKGLAKTSGTPGKTALINHFIIEDTWYLVDLPGYGYAKTSKTNRATWIKNTKHYLSRRRNLICTFLLIDSRIELQKVDKDFMQWMGEKSIPFVIIFTKIDKLSSSALHKNILNYKKKLLNYWETLPQTFLSSSETSYGRDEILRFINNYNAQFLKPQSNSST